MRNPYKPKFDPSKSAEVQLGIECRKRFPCGLDCIGRDAMRVYSAQRIRATRQVRIRFHAFLPRSCELDWGSGVGE